jgi:hypothetical protein
MTKRLKIYKQNDMVEKARGGRMFRGLSVLLQITAFERSQWNLTDLSQIVLHLTRAGLVEFLAGRRVGSSPSSGKEVVGSQSHEHMQTSSAGTGTGVMAYIRCVITDGGAAQCTESFCPQEIFFSFFFYYSYVHTRLGSFLPLAPTPSLTTHSTPSLFSKG